MAGESESPFYCVYCMQSVYKKEILELKEPINTLTLKISQLLESFQGQNPTQNVTPAATKTTQDSTSRPTPSSSARLASTISTDDSRKYNVLLFGLKECTKGTNRSDRTKQELDQITNIFSIEKNVGPRDSFRLGKYDKKSSRPRLS